MDRWIEVRFLAGELWLGHRRRNDARAPRLQDNVHGLRGAPPRVSEQTCDGDWRCRLPNSVLCSQCAVMKSKGYLNVITILSHGVIENDDSLRNEALAFLSSLPTSCFVSFSTSRICLAHPGFFTD